MSGNPGSSSHSKAVLSEAHLLGLVLTPIHHWVMLREGQLVQIPPTAHVATLDGDGSVVLVPPIIHLAVDVVVHDVVLGPVLSIAKPESQVHMGSA